jgi:hypothetical protein
MFEKIYLMFVKALDALLFNKCPFGWFFLRKNTSDWLLICSERKVLLVADKASEQDAYAYIFK